MPNNNARNEMVGRKQAKIYDTLEELETLFQEHFVLTLDPKTTLEMIRESIDRLAKLHQDLHVDQQ